MRTFAVIVQEVFLEVESLFSEEEICEGKCFYAYKPLLSVSLGAATADATNLVAEHKFVLS